MMSAGTHDTHKLAHSIADAVRLCSLSRAFVYQQISAGRLKVFKVGKRTLVADADLRAWLESFRTSGKDAA